jgi:two-component system, NarL family, sensor kinase
MQFSTSNIAILLIVITTLLLSLTAFIVGMLFFYQKRQLAYHKNIEKIKSEYEKDLLNVQIEIQEQTFQNISREIHDNINLSLTLAKLHLNTLKNGMDTESCDKVDLSIRFITHAINDLSNISGSLNSEIIDERGLISALEQEIENIRKLNCFIVKYDVTGATIYMESQKELLLFRIIQEVFNNILKHAKAKVICVQMHYTEESLEISIEDDGVGFAVLSNELKTKSTSGLRNIQKRAELLNGTSSIKSVLGKGTKITVLIPF